MRSTSGDGGDREGAAVDPHAPGGHYAEAQAARSAGIEEDTAAAIGIYGHRGQPPVAIEVR